jgi:hypothetical protein
MNISPRTVEKLEKIGHKYRCKLCLPPFRNRMNLFYDARKIKRGTELKLCREVQKLGLQVTIWEADLMFKEFEFIEVSESNAAMGWED